MLRRIPAWCGSVIGAVVLSISAAAPAVASAPPDAGVTIYVDGTPVATGASISGSGDITAVMNAYLSPGGGARDLSMAFTGPLKYKAGSIIAPEGATIKWSTDSGASWVNIEPTPATSITNVRARRAAVVDGSTIGSVDFKRTISFSPQTGDLPAAQGGDGWDVFFGGDKAYAVFHHEYTTIDCFSRLTAQRCAGYPFRPLNVNRFGAYYSFQSSSGWVDTTTNRLYTWAGKYADTSGLYADAGILCIDVSSTPGECGFTSLSTGSVVGRSQYLAHLGPQFYVNGRIVTVDRNNAKVGCFDVAAVAKCANSPYAFAGAAQNSDVPAGLVDGKLIIAADSDIVCIDPATMAPCTGGAWPVTYASIGKSFDRFPIAPHTDASGVIDGFCRAAYCMNMNGVVDQSMVSPYSLLITAPSTTPSDPGYGNGVVRVQLHGTRLLFPKGNVLEVIDCYDYATAGRCANYPMTLTVPGVWNPYVYAFNPDPVQANCMWMNNNAGIIKRFNVVDATWGCSAGAASTEVAQTPRMTCAAADTIKTWKTATLSTVVGTPGQMTLSINDSQGNAISGWQGIALGLNSPIDLSTLTFAQTGANPSFTLTVVSGELLTGVVDVVYSTTAAELCVGLEIDPEVPLTECSTNSGVNATLDEFAGTAYATTATSASGVNVCAAGYVQPGTSAPQPGTSAPNVTNLPSTGSNVNVLVLVAFLVMGAGVVLKKSRRTS